MVLDNLSEIMFRNVHWNDAIKHRLEQNVNCYLLTINFCACCRTLFSYSCLFWLKRKEKKGEIKSAEAKCKIFSRNLVLLFVGAYLIFQESEFLSKRGGRKEPQETQKEFSYLVFWYFKHFDENQNKVYIGIE